MVKPVLYIILCFYIVPHLSAQENLVPNGSFEEYNWCPNSVDGYYIIACEYWTMPSLGTSDYFNSCSTETDGTNPYHLFSVPQNYIGFQYARTGAGYAGLVFVQTEVGTPIAAEYIQVKLNTATEAGKFYHLQFFVNNSDTICTNSIGATFSPTELNVGNNDIITPTPDFQSDLSQFFCDTTRWFELNYVFQADGDERFLIIGVFTPMPLIQNTDYQGNIVIDEVTPYLYIDDVSLIEIDYEAVIKEKIPNVFTPNGDGINDSFAFENSVVQAKKLSILNRWGNVVFTSDSVFSWDGTFNGQPVTEGVYYYIIEAMQNIKLNGFISLMR